MMAADGHHASASSAERALRRRGLLCAADHVLRAQLRAVISSGDAYTGASSSRVHRMLVVASSALLGRSL
jgi:hypothetical protein